MEMILIPQVSCVGRDDSHLSWNAWKPNWMSTLLCKLYSSTRWEVFCVGGVGKAFLKERISDQLFLRYIKMRKEM